MREALGDLARVILAAAVAHVYVVLFFTIAIEEAGVPLPIPGDLVIAYYGWRSGGDRADDPGVRRRVDGGHADPLLALAALRTHGDRARGVLARRRHGS